MGKVLAQFSLKFELAGNILAWFKLKNDLEWNVLTYLNHENKWHEVFQHDSTTKRNQYDMIQHCFCKLELAQNNLVWFNHESKLARNRLAQFSHKVELVQNILAWFKLKNKLV